MTRLDSVLLWRWPGAQFEVVDNTRGRDAIIRAWHGPMPRPSDQDVIAAVDDYESQQVEVWSSLRETRDRLLRESDWSQLPDVPSYRREAFQSYRQALRELPNLTSDPTAPIWPTPL